MQDSTVPTSTDTTAVQPLQTTQPMPDPARPEFMSTGVPDQTALSSPPTPSAIPPIDTPPSVLSTQGSGSNSSNIKKIAAVLGILLLVSATGAGVLLLKNSSVNQTQAWDCTKYNFSVSQQGSVNVINGSTDNVPPHKATVKIDNNQVASFDVPVLAPGQSSKLGDVDVPSSGAFTWEVTGSVNCSDGGSFAAAAALAQCTGIIAYTPTWEPLTSAQLAALLPGEKIRFTVSSQATEGTVDKARFTINGTLLPDVSTLRPGSNDFYVEYTIPAAITDFKITAEVHHLESDTWN